MKALISIIFIFTLFNATQGQSRHDTDIFRMTYGSVELDDTGNYCLDNFRMADSLKCFLRTTGSQVQVLSFKTTMLLHKQGLFEMNVPGALIPEFIHDYLDSASPGDFILVHAVTVKFQGNKTATYRTGVLHKCALYP